MKVSAIWLAPCGQLGLFASRTERRRCTQTPASLPIRMQPNIQGRECPNDESGNRLKIVTRSRRNPSDSVFHERALILFPTSGFLRVRGQ